MPRVHERAGGRRRGCGAGGVKIGDCPLMSRTTPPPLELDYESNPVHRDSARHSHHTQWSRQVSERDEFLIFCDAVAQAWGERNTSFWGIKIDENGRLMTLNDPSCHDGRVAKWCRFVCNTTPEIWHGYPQWPETGKRPNPPQRVLLQWADYWPLSIAKVTKILRGRRCNF